MEGPVPDTEGTGTLEKEIRQAFAESANQDLPEDKYFKKIWNSIECKAPVGEKYYLRSFFVIFFILLFFAIFVLFYNDFLASVMTLKAIHKENIAYFRTSPWLLTTPFETRTLDKEIELAGVIKIVAREKSQVTLKAEDEKQIVLDFFQGHVVIKKTDEKRCLVVLLPGVILRSRHSPGLCNVFCYDGMIRVIPLSHEVEVEYNGQTRLLMPGTLFFMLNGTPMVVENSTKRSP